MTGSHIDHVDDSGLHATGDIRDGVLHHEHLVLHREGKLRPLCPFGEESRL
ncbi:Atu4866 domain-containing protein [Streptomyces shenzhenensis]|uniref:Atu4866 domain-containing protein n=1 Tax=Streptomyces shenzhenensis TaxID=943815 RepID=UPI00368BFA64